MNNFKILNKNIGINSDTYFIADIAANHDGDIQKAKELIYSCAEAGADAAKFQNFHARTIVSDHGFKSLKGSKSHQSKWKKSVYDTYKDAELPLEWSEEMKDTCEKAGVHYLTSPYSPEIIDSVSQYVSAWKIGSGDITWHDAIVQMAKTNKPVILATGASTIDDVRMAVKVATNNTSKFALLQCNTNYTAQPDEQRDVALSRMESINLKVLGLYAREFPDIVLGLSDHTIGQTTAVAAVGLFDARIIEKHYTLDNSLPGPDHGFSMNPKTWRKMVDSIRNVEKLIKTNWSYEDRLKAISPYIDIEELNAAMGDGVKRIESNESDTVILQRRGICASNELSAGHIITKDDLTPLRPQLKGAFLPYQLDKVIGRTLRCGKSFGETIYIKDFEL
jgi:sialic acid synthase SpsE